MSGYWSIVAIIGGAWLSGFVAGLFWRDCRAAIEEEEQNNGKLDKLAKLKVANEVYQWWMIYAQNAGYRKEPVMRFGVWLLHVIGKVEK